MWQPTCSVERKAPPFLKTLSDGAVHERQSRTRAEVTQQKEKIKKLMEDVSLRREEENKKRLIRQKRLEAEQLKRDAEKRERDLKRCTFMYVHVSSGTVEKGAHEKCEKGGQEVHVHVVSTFTACKCMGMYTHGAWNSSKRSRRALSKS
jgi:hypothetical protein